ncbi:hypothetical protein [Methylobacterium sp. SD21]|jgi:hypothetical protein|uniref:hypothetical protein n=1 Tax=Methylobacterium litchii TaxID=3138810 RepID=UPI00313DAF74
MTRITSLTITAAMAFAIATPAFAQVLESPTTTTVVVPRGAPGVVTPLNNTTGGDAAVSYSPTGRPADSISNDSAAAGNAGQPSRVAPQGGGGGK